MRHVLSLLLENESGALSRVSGLFSSRGYNIESLTVAPTEDASMSRMTIVTTGSDDVIEQITKQLNKLIDALLRGVKTDDRNLLSKFDGQRQADITQADDGDFEGRCGGVQHGLGLAWGL